VKKSSCCCTAPTGTPTESGKLIQLARLKHEKVDQPRTPSVPYGVLI
jgi:hypothetical protein